MRTGIKHTVRIGVTMLLLMAGTFVMYAQRAAGITPDKAPRITAPETLTVQSGSNYIRIAPDHLPAIVTYMADTAFGPLPMALVMGDTLEAQMVFDTCHMAWRWSIEEAESDKIIEIKAHENASIVALPHVCPVTTSDTVAATCGTSYEWRGTTYYESGDYSITLTNVAGCDSIRTLHLKFNQSTKSDTIAEVCGTSFEWHGTTYDESGEYPIRLTNVAGCDSIRTLYLTLKQPTSSDTTARVCGTSFEWRGITCDRSGEYPITLTNAAGCDSIRTLRLTLSQPTSSDTTASVCGTSFEWRGTTYYESGDHSITLTNAAGCDSIRTLRLTLKQPTSSEETLEECDSVLWNGEWRKESGDYEYHTTNAAGCDSTVTLHLTIHHSYHITLPNDTGCVGINSSGYWFIDTLITTPGTYSRRGKTKWGGCDSIVTQYVAIAEESLAYDVVTAYDSCKWINGKTYYQTYGGPICTLTNVAGCDSIVTLDLTIRHLAVSDTVYDTKCLAAGESYSWKGKNYTESGTYSTDTIHGSAVNKVYMDTLHTLVLTVNKAYAVDTVVSVCANEYVWRGTTYKQSGNYLYEGKTVALCDSIVTLRLTLKQATAGEQTETAYESYKWHGETYTESGDYTFQTVNVAGCDSIATLHLTILPKPIVYDTITEYFCPKSGIVEHVDTQSDPHVRYLSYVYEKPNEELFMNGVVSDETDEGANVNFERVLSNLDAYYVIPLTPVEMINWRYMPIGGQSEALNPGTGAQWMKAGTISMDIVFRCGYRYYSAFTVGKMSEGMERIPVSEQPVKRIENGQVVIIRGGAKYTVFGTKIE